MDIVIEALKDLQDGDVPVLFAPFPQMNEVGYWYSAENTDDSDNEFEELWGYVLDAAPRARGSSVNLKVLRIKNFCILERALIIYVF